jgi:KDO2-lipid IV(A) lauroyltransferase
MLLLAVDFCRMPRIDAANLARHVDFRALAELRKLHAEGRGVICVSGHIGVWELLGHAACLAGVPVSIVARRIPRPPLHDLVDSIRRHAGQEMITQRGALWQLKKALGRGRVIGLLADEDTPAKPIFVPFLGTLAASNPAAAFLQRVSGAPIAVVGCQRVGRERFRIDVWRVIPYAGTPDADADATPVTAAIAEALSRAILARPEQWLWGSRRYLTRPSGERPGPDGLPPRAP